MACCQHRPEEGCLLVACSSVMADRRCLCSEEVKGELKAEETRVARVPDSAREGAA